MPWATAQLCGLALPLRANAPAQATSEEPWLNPLDKALGISQRPSLGRVAASTGARAWAGGAFLPAEQVRAGPPADSGFQERSPCSEGEVSPGEEKQNPAPPVTLRRFIVKPGSGPSTVHRVIASCLAFGFVFSVKAPSRCCLSKPSQRHGLLGRLHDVS